MIGLAGETPEQRGNGTLVAVLASGNYLVELDDPKGHTVRAYTAGKLRKFRTKIAKGDRVTVEISPYDKSHGRIVKQFS